MSDHPPRWVTVREAAHETRSSERTIRRWIEKQAVTIRRIGPSKRLRMTFAGSAGSFNASSAHSRTWR